MVGLLRAIIMLHMSTLLAMFSLYQPQVLRTSGSETPRQTADTMNIPTGVLGDEGARQRDIAVDGAGVRAGPQTEAGAEVCYPTHGSNDPVRASCLSYLENA
jgi:hypothetical protein